MSAEEDLVDYEEEEEEPTRVKGSTAVKKGRGHRDSKGGDRDRGGVFENLHTGDTTAGPAPSVEGWVIFVSGLHQEAQEDQVLDIFQEIGDVKNIQINLDRRTGFVKGYALVEFETKEEAERAIKELDGVELLEQTLKLDWAFVKPAGGGRRRGSR